MQGRRITVHQGVPIDSGNVARRKRRTMELSTWNPVRFDFNSELDVGQGLMPACFMRSPGSQWISAFFTFPSRTTTNQASKTRRTIRM